MTDPIISAVVKAQRMFDLPRGNGYHRLTISLWGDYLAGALTIGEITEVLDVWIEEMEPPEREVPR